MNQAPEQIARDNIDTQLQRCGWVVQDKNSINLSAGPGIAVRVTSNNNILNLSYLNFHIQKIKNEIDRKASATAQKNINIKFLEQLIIPITNINSQNQIVRKIESRLSVCDKIEEDITNTLQQAESLRLSIIKKAFEGKLLTEAEIRKCRQQPDYKPASE